MPIPLTRLHTSCVYLLPRGGGGSQSRHHSACERQQKEQFDVTSSRRQYPTVPATSCRGIDARFNGDIGYVVIDVSLLRRRVATRGRGCRPQRVDFGRKQSTRAVTSCRLHSLPQRTNPQPARVRPFNTTWPTSHASASLWGGVMPTNKRGC